MAIHLGEDYGKGMQEAINNRYKELYRNKYGKRNPATLSSTELDQLMSEAARLVQQKRR